MLRTVHTLCGLKTVSGPPKSLEATQRIQLAKECTDLSKDNGGSSIRNYSLAHRLNLAQCVVCYAVY